MTALTSSLPSTFLTTAQSFPERVDRVLATVTDVSGAERVLAEGRAIEQLARDLRFGAEFVNPVVFGCLKVQAHVGRLAPRGERGRGKKNSKPPLPFSKPTIAQYRKVADHNDQIQDYYDFVMSAADPEYMSTAGFIRFVNADGNMATKFTGYTEWYTPAVYIEKSRAVMGSIDCDPASSDFAQKTVQAGIYFTAADDGLSQEWCGRVFLNPPFKMPLIAQFVDKLCVSFQSGDVSQAVLLTNNNTDAGWWHQAFDVASAVCFTKGRIAFYNKTGESSSPTNGQSLFYFGERVTDFSKHFADVGAIAPLDHHERLAPTGPVAASA